MFETLSRWLVQQPGNILLIAAGYAALWALLRATILRAAPRANVFLVPAILCLAYAAWEWLLLRKSPEADIRVDLLVIWLVIAIATVWAVVRAARGGLQRNNRAGVRERT
jgi:hypothetical protein